MFKTLKNIFTPNTVSSPKNPPGRTFKRILTGEYFGYKNKNIHESKQTEAQIKIIQQIQEHQVQPTYIKYTYQNDEIFSTHLTFQKEVFAEKWNMLHVTEISFTLYAEDFKRFEEIAKVTLAEDFRELRPENKTLYQGEERRKVPRT